MDVLAWSRALDRPDADIDLARAALLIAGIDHPTRAIEDYLGALDGLADRSGARGIADPMTRLGRLRQFLFETEGFRGNVADYHDPRNSCLNDVLDRRLGIPITLSLVVMEVGRRVGLTIDGIGLPGHFVVRARCGATSVLLDPFNGGRDLTRDACADLMERAVGRPMTLHDEHLAPVTKRQFLARMLNNLKAIYWQRAEWERALAVVRHLMALDPGSPGEVRDQGTVLNQLGDYRRGLAEWERYLALCPNASDAETLRAALRRARMTLAALN
jgi:regulator of sirC expression with transglutaminase-like and TPR domain